MQIIRKIALSILLLCSIYADDVEELSFFDAKDGQLDLGEYMSQAYGFLPVPILITEPAVGYGGGAALIYLHDKLLGKKSSTGRRIPPGISGIVLAATQNGTTITGAFHKGYWLEDNLRTMSYVGAPNIYIDMYTSNSSFELHLDGTIFYQDFKYRLADTNIFLGASYMYINSEITLGFEDIDKIFGGEVNIASFGIIAEYDSRDNQMSPNTGVLLSSKINLFDKIVGSDYNYENYKLSTLFYNKLTDTINLDFNFLAETVNGDDNEIPVYLYPFISMRGIPVMKYQGGSVATAQAQLTYRFQPRWSALVFGGVGRTFSKQIYAPNRSFKDAPNVFAGGIGFRYLIAKKFGLRMGIDIAKSKEDKAFYIQFGTAWHGL